MGEGVGEGSPAPRVAVGLSEMSKLDPQAGQEREDAWRGAAQEGQASMETARVL
jgi:hypothetical protein